MPEEVVLLVGKGLHSFSSPSSLITSRPGFAALVDDPRSHFQPTTAQLQSWNTQRLNSIKHQVDVKGIRDEAITGRAMTDAAIQKRKEREEKRARAATPPPDTPVASLPSLSTPDKTSTPSTQDSAPQPSYTITVPATSSSFDWYNPAARSYLTIANAKAAGIWNYPATLRERAKCGVFKGLWEQGFFIGGGIRFGGDYLIYPGLSLLYFICSLAHRVIKVTLSVITPILWHRSLIHPPRGFDQWR